MILETWEGVKPEVGGARERISDHRDFERWCLRIVVAAETNLSSSDSGGEEAEAEAEAECVDNECLVNASERTVRLVRDETIAIDKPYLQFHSGILSNICCSKIFGKTLVIIKRK